MSRRYHVEFRRKLLDLIEAGKPLAEIAAQLGITAQTDYNWRNQDQIDRGVRAGMSTAEAAEFTAARKRIRYLETNTRRGRSRDARSTWGSCRRWDQSATATTTAR